MEHASLHTVLRALGRIEGQLEGIQREQARSATYTIQTSERVGKLERATSYRTGWAAGAGAAGGLLFTLLRNMFP
jgi:hypothetical protein